MCDCHAVLVVGETVIPWIIQGAYNSGKHGNLREFLNSEKLREFEIYFGNFCISDAIFRDAVWNTQQANV